MPLELLIYLVIVGVMSLFTFCLYAWDKRRARRGGWRTPEATLHTAELFGGWPGGMAGRKFLRHKSAKLSFRVQSWLIIALHAAAVAAWGYWRWG